MLTVWLLWIFACAHHFAGVWDAWGGVETRLLKAAEVSGNLTFRLVIDIVLYLRKRRADMVQRTNRRSTTSRTNDHEHDSQNEEVEQLTDPVTSDEEYENRRNNFSVDEAHIMLLQLCTCSRNPCVCKPDPRVPDTIFYKRDPSYEAKVHSLSLIITIYLTQHNSYAGNSRMCFHICLPFSSTTTLRGGDA